MKIIGFIASQRKEGNTAWIVNRILEGAKERGAETQAWYSGDLDIKPCRGCLGCVQGNGCVTKDDMQKLYASLKDTDALVLGSPIYMGQMSAQAKTFTDRLFAQITPRFSPRFKEENAGKKLILAFNQGNPDPDIFKVYIDYTQKMFQMLEFNVINVQVITGTRNGPVNERKDLQKTLTELGSSMVI
ncbi:MAG: flavodoxin family protein [Treponema sp.]|nr:flavodoxin family protein [Treponema sp.]